MQVIAQARGIIIRRAYIPVHTQHLIAPNCAIFFQDMIRLPFIIGDVGPTEGKHRALCRQAEEDTSGDNKMPRF